MNKVFVLIVAVFFAVVNTLAQDCQTRLYETFKLYETGHFEEAIKNLDTCLKTGCDKSLQARAWKLIAYCNISLGDTLKSQEAVKKFLLLTPLYTVSDRGDPAQFKYLVKRFRPKPKLAIGLSYSKVFSRAFLQQSYSLQGVTKDYTIGNDRALGLHLVYNNSQRFMFSANATYLNQTFGFSQNVLGFDVKHKEHSTGIQAGVWAGYQFLQSKGGLFHSSWYGFGGVHYLGLLYDQADLSRTYTSTGTETADQRTDILERRKIHIAGWDVGLGFSASVFFAELHVSGNLSSMVLAQNRYADHRSMYDYYFVDDDFWIGSLQLKIGVLKTLKYQVK